MLTRRIGKVLRGKATPFQLMLACVLASMLGFVPSFSTSPGLVLALVLLLIMLNANLAVAALIGALAKVLSLVMMPVTFAIGRVLLDGPTQGLFKPLINAPVLALFGLEYYATTGGLVMGVVVGVLSGFLVLQGVGRFRRRMAKLEQESERYKKYTSRRSTKVLLWLFVGGGHGKKTYEQLAAKRVGLPVRPLGVGFAVVVIAFLFIGVQFLSEPVVTMALQRGLERANGATVDVHSAQLDLGAGRLTVQGLAMADPNDLQRDVFRAATLTADVSGADLLRKRLRLDSVVVSEATSGEQRSRPGVRVTVPPRPSPGNEKWFPVEPGEKTIDDYIETAEQWKQRIAQVRRWLEKVGGSESVEEPGEETWRQRIEREIREKGYARVAAEHLIEGTPTLVITHLQADGVRATQLDGEVLDVTATNLSTHPSLLAESPQIVVRSRSGNLDADVTMPGGTNADGSVSFACRQLPVDRFSDALRAGGEPMLQGGTMNVSLNGVWSSNGVGFIDLPLNVTLHNTTLRLGDKSSPISQFSLPIGLRGPMDDPRITIDDDLLAQALVQAGADELTAELRGKADEEINKALEDIGDRIGDDAGGVLDSVLGGGKKKSDG